MIFLKLGLGYEAADKVIWNEPELEISYYPAAEYVFWVDANTNDAVETSEVAASRLDGISEGGTDPTNSDLANLGFALNNSPSSGTSLITLRGLPDILSLNKGAKTSTGDWLLTTSDLTGVKILDNSGNFSGNFSLSLWTTTTVGAESAVSTSSKMIIDVAPVADDPNLKVREIVPGEEDAGRDANGNIVSNISESKPIPLPFRFELGDKSETISINVKLFSSNNPISGAELVTVDQSNGAITSLGKYQLRALMQHLI